jgi:hypothetical protein
MKKAVVFFLFFIAGVDLSSVSCVSNTNEPTDTTKIKPLEANAPGTWEGLIVPINMGDIHFNGARVFLDVPGTDSSTFRMVAREADSTRLLSPSVKDTLLILSGIWTLKSNPDSIVLNCSYCRVVDTTEKILYDRPVDTVRIALPLTMEKSEEGLILWKVSFADLAPLIPLLGLTISDDNAGLLKMFKIELQKTMQEQGPILKSL